MKRMTVNREMKVLGNLSLPRCLRHSFQVGIQSNLSVCMMKTLDMIAEVIRNRKHPFPQVADRPDKPHKNRYERRKIKQYIHLGNWAEEAKT